MRLPWAERQDHRGPLDILLGRGNELPQRMTVVLSDYSSAGVGFASIESMRVGEIFLVCLTMPDGGEVNVPCVVANCRPHDDGSYRVGAEFQQVLCDVDRQAFGRVEPRLIDHLPIN